VTTAQDGGKVVSLTHQPPLPHREILLVLISVRGWVDPRAIVRSEGFVNEKFPMTPSGIEPATFRFVAQLLNHMYRVSITYWTCQTNVQVRVCSGWGNCKYLQSWGMLEITGHPCFKLFQATPVQGWRLYCWRVHPVGWMLMVMHSIRHVAVQWK